MKLTYYAVRYKSVSDCLWDYVCEGDVPWLTGSEFEAMEEAGEYADWDDVSKAEVVTVEVELP